MNQTLRQICALWGLPADVQGTPVEVPGRGRVHLPQLFADLGFTTGAEVGVWKGEFSHALCQGIPHLRLTAVDAWTPYVGYIDHTRHDGLTAAMDLARERLRPYGATVIRGFSVPVAATIPNESLDFVYIDANHDFPNVVADLAAWVPKVRPGGVVSGHDYFPGARRSLNIRVIEALNGWTSAHDISPWFVLGRTKVRPFEYTERARSWLFVKG